MEFAVFSQKLELDFDFVTQSLRGRTVITIEPKIADLKAIRINSRQCKIKSVAVEGRRAEFTYRDPYSALQLYPQMTVKQHHILKDRLEENLYMDASQPEEPLEIVLPASVKVQSQAVLPATVPLRQINGNIDADEDMLDAPGPKSAVDAQVSYAMLEVGIEFEVRHFRDGAHFVGLEAGDERYPHLYTCNSDFPGAACSVFPCVDNATTRHEWDISIRYPRTLGDAMQKRLPAASTTASLDRDAGLLADASKASLSDEYVTPLNQEDKALEMRVICSGNLTDDVADHSDPTRKIASFRIDDPVAARHVGFAIGPFEYIDLSEYRESDQDEKLGTHAVRVHGFCLPGRASEVRNTCMPLAAAVDFFSTNYVAYPYTNHKVLFVDDLSSNLADSASLSICSTRLLIPEDILDPLYEATRELLRGLAAQWVGILVFPRNPQDFWITVGGAHFMADQFGAQLWGKNEQRYRLKLAANQVIDQDVRQPSLHDLGYHIADIPGWLDFMKLKSPVVLQILHQRLIKSSGRNGVNRIFWRVLTNTKTETMADGAISTPAFARICEKVGHTKLDVFFNQWIYGAGYPIFLINQKFNKKKLCVEMLLKQTQSEQSNAESGVPINQHQLKEQITAENLRRSAKEDQAGVVPSEVQRVFNGPMTIRIHEADGTPYEHIVEIKDAVTRIDIPYNTKYKRLKRSKRQKERQQANAAANPGADGQDETLLYCLGDVLQTEAEFRDWRLQDWPEEEETRMGQESYEWIRVDKDFEWISKTYFIQPGYMYVSQLQQDNDVVAQIEALEWMRTQRGTPLMATFLIRTLMDSRYFHGVRTMAADLLSSCGDIGFYHLEKAFQTFYCLPNSPMTRSNDFSNRAEYLLQCAIPKAMAKIRDSNGKVPFDIRQFFIDKLKFNDNSNNEYSDCYYVSTIMSCLAESLTTVGRRQVDEFSLGDAAEEDIRWRDTEFLKKAVHEIERYRRIDEWIPSFQNVYSVHSLDCIMKLMDAKTVARKGVDFLQYTQAGNSDEVRLKAFEAVARLGMLQDQSILAYCILSLATDPSPYFRQQLWEYIWLGFGIALFTEQPREVDSAPAQNGSLILEQASTDNRQELAKRTESIEGALEALKGRLASFDLLPDTLLNALASDKTSAIDFLELLDVCEVLYEPEDKLVVVLKHPHYWRAEHLGRGKVRFYHSDRLRLKSYNWDNSPLKSAREGASSAHSKNAKPRMLRLTTNQRSVSPDLKRRPEFFAADAPAQPPPKIRLMTKRPSQASPPPPVSIQTPAASTTQSSMPPSMTNTIPSVPAPAPLAKAASPPSAPAAVQPIRASPMAATSQRSATPKVHDSLIVKLKVSRHWLAKLEAEPARAPVHDVPSPASSDDVPLFQIPMKASTSSSPIPPIMNGNDRPAAPKHVDSTSPVPKVDVPTPPPLERRQTIKIKFGTNKG